MKWDEFQALLVGISPDTPLGRIVAIRSEEDKNVLKRFTASQRRIRSEWRRRKAQSVSKEQMEQVLNDIKQAFFHLAGQGTGGDVSVR